MRISDWSSDVCSSDLSYRPPQVGPTFIFIEDVVAIKIVVAGNTPEVTRKWHERFVNVNKTAQIIAWAEGQALVDAEYALVWMPHVLSIQQAPLLNSAFYQRGGVYRHRGRPKTKSK